VTKPPFKLGLLPVLIQWVIFLQVFNEDESLNVIFGLAHCVLVPDLIFASGGDDAKL